MISEAGHQTEIASLTSASIYFNVFNRVLQETLDNIFKAKDQMELDNLLPDFQVLASFVYSCTSFFLIYKMF